MDTETRQDPLMETPSDPGRKRSRQKSKEQLLSEGWQKLSPGDLKTLVTDLSKEFGGAFSSVFQELNRRKVFTPKSAMWNYQNLKNYLDKNPDIVAKRPAEGESKRKAKAKKSQGVPRREEPAKETFPLQARAPMWKEDLKSGKMSVYAKEELLKRADEKAKKEKLKTGGNLSSLCAVLLWHYIGCPDDLVETE